MIAIHHQVRNHKTAIYMATFPRLKSNIPIKTQRLKRFLGWKFRLVFADARTPSLGFGLLIAGLALAAAFFYYGGFLGRSTDCAESRFRRPSGNLALTWSSI